MQEPPSLDIAVIAFPDHAPPVYANILSWRDCPEGQAVQFDPQTLAVTGIRWQKDARDANMESYLWHKGARWTELALTPLNPPDSGGDQTTPSPQPSSNGRGSQISPQPSSNGRGSESNSPLPLGEGAGGEGKPFVISYPASLLKLMPAVMVMRLVDKGKLQLDTPYSDAAGVTKLIEQWLDEMITVSSNEATFAIYRLLHALGELSPEQNHLNKLFASLGLSTLQSNDTRASDGSFFNSGGSGVGAHHMTAWDTARLLWLLDTATPRPTWQVQGQPVHYDFMSAASKDMLVNRFLGQQAQHEMLSTTACAGVPGRVAGIPAWLPERWLDEQGYFTAYQTLQVSNLDLRPHNAAAEVTFAHKTGLTENYGSDAGIVRGIAGKAKRHYIIAFISNLGYRYTNTQGIYYPQTIPAMAAEIDTFLKAHLE